MAITGDKSDNIPGIKGIGEEGAKFLIKKYESVDNILNNIDTIDKKYKDKILQNIDNLKLSKELVKLVEDVKIDFSIDELFFNGLKNKIEVLEFMTKFEFFSIIEKVKNLFVEQNSDDLFNQNSEYQLQGEKQIENIKERRNIAEINLLDVHDVSEIFIAENIIISFSEDYKNAYFYNPECNVDKIYRISLEDIFFHNEQLNDKFSNAKNIKNIYTDNAKYFYSIANDIGFGNINYELFDVLLAGYILDASLQNTKLVYNKFLKKDFKADDSEIIDKLDAIFELVVPLKKELADNGLFDVYNGIDLKFCRVLAGIEKNGLKIDVNYLIKFRDELNSKISNIVKDIYKETGEIFNINSPKQLGEVLFEKLKLPIIKKTKTGISTSEEILTELAKTSPIPAKILDYREINKIVSTYINPILERIDSKNRIKTSFNFTNTNTGRLSSSSPNLQNIPVKTDLANDLRKAFVCDENYFLVSVDYSQIDLVVLAHLSRDINMCRAFLNGQDIHSWTASQIFGKGESLISKKERDIAKRINFGLVYGISPYGLSQDLDISIEEAKTMIEIYFKNYPQLKDYLDSIIKQAKDSGFVKTILGRKRYVPELNSKNVQLQKFGERIAYNTPIQGSSADIIKKAMVDLYNYFENKTDEVKILLQIHDEILFEIREDVLEKNLRIIKQKMEATIKLSVPLKVNVKTGKTWANMV
jgi:DNA polymerase-1